MKEEKVVKKERRRRFMKKMMILRIDGELAIASILAAIARKRFFFRKLINESWS